MQGLNSDPRISPNVNQRPQQQQNFFLDPALRQMQDLPTSLPQQTSPILPHQSNTNNSQISPYQISNQIPYSNFAANIQTTYPDLGTFNELDFLDSFPVQGSNAAGTADGGGGLGDLGFGMGFDGSHDFSDGNGLDLFDGFFFGPGGTGGNGGGL